MTPDPQRFKLCESVHGTWFYHLAPVGSNSVRALCGAHTMQTSAPNSSWGFKGHLNESYCSKCAEIALTPGHPDDSVPSMTTTAFPSANPPEGAVNAYDVVVTKKEAGEVTEKRTIGIVWKKRGEDWWRSQPAAHEGQTKEEVVGMMVAAYEQREGSI